MSAELLERGPLGLFLKADRRRALRRRPARAPARDQHPRLARRRTTSYDAERRTFGRHCQAGTWGARLHRRARAYLDPEPPHPDGRPASASAATCASTTSTPTRCSTSGRAGTSAPRATPKFHPSELERLLDVLITGSRKRSTTSRTRAARTAPSRRRERRQSQVLNRLALEAASAERGRGVDAALRRRDRRLHRHQGAAPAGRPARRATSSRTSPSRTRSPAAGASSATCTGSTSPTSC